MVYRICLNYTISANHEHVDKIFQWLQRYLGTKCLFSKILAQNHNTNTVEYDCIITLINQPWFQMTNQDIAVRQLEDALEHNIFILPIIMEDFSTILDENMDETLRKIGYKKAKQIRFDDHFPDDMYIIAQDLCQFLEISIFIKKEETICQSFSQENPISITSDNDSHEWDSFIRGLVDDANSPKPTPLPFSSPVISQISTHNLSNETPSFENGCIENDLQRTSLHSAENNVGMNFSSQIFFDLRGIRFFEDGEQARSAELRLYQTEFLQRSTRYVYCEVKVSNLLYRKKSHDHQVFWKYTHSNGNVLGEISAHFHIEPDWYSAWHQHGLGWKNPGSWPLGRYIVEVHCDNLFLGSDTFYIIEHSKPSHNYSNKYFEVFSFRFFESGAKVPNIQEREYHAQFSQVGTRYIYCEVLVRNMFYQQTTHMHRIRWEYYKPNGELCGSIAADFDILPEWYSAWHQRGFGWEIPGKWEKGMYIVKIYCDEDFIGEESFIIY